MHGRAESQVTLASRSSAVEKAMQMEIQKVSCCLFCSRSCECCKCTLGKFAVKDDGFSCNQFPKRLINSSHTLVTQTTRMNPSESWVLSIFIIYKLAMCHGIVWRQGHFLHQRFNNLLTLFRAWGYHLMRKSNLFVQKPIARRSHGRSHVK